MSKILKRLAAFCLTVSLLCMSGCRFASLDADGLLRAPKLTGDQAAVQGALEEYILQKVGQSQADYTLKCPKGGEILTSFVFLDDGQEPTQAAAFYCCPAQSANVRILYLEKQQDGWQGLTDVEGSAEDIGQVFVADVDGDGQRELLVGWDLYTTRDHRLKIYDAVRSNGGYGWQVIYDASYSALVTADMTAAAAADILLFNIVTTEQHASVRLLSFEDGQFVVKGSARIDGGIAQVTNAAAVRWSDGKAGVFVDGVRDGRIYMTELILWDGEQLVAPLNESLSTRRSSDLPCADTNRNGIPEWPQSEPLPGYEQTEPDSTLWQTTYYEWTGDGARETVTALVNAVDGYRIELGAELIGRVTAVYREQDRQMEMRLTETGEPLLRVQVGSTQQSLPDGFRLLQQTKAMQCSFWVSDAKDALLTPEQARYMIVLI